MNKTFKSIICIVLIAICVFLLFKDRENKLVNNSTNNATDNVVDESSTLSNDSENPKVIVKIDEIDYKLVRKKNASGEDLVFVQYTNNSKYTIESFGIEVFADNYDEGFFINNEVPVAPGQKSDNFDLSTTKDKRAKVPLNDKYYNNIKDLGKIEEKNIFYEVLANGKKYNIIYNIKTKEYDVSVDNVE